MAVSGDTTPKAERRFPFPPMRVTLTILILAGYVALAITGFAIGLRRGDPLQAVPLYIYFSALLLALQFDLSRNQSISRILYLFVTSGFALVYAGSVTFFGNENNFTKSPYTYIVLNFLLVVVFIYDAFDRRREAPDGLEAQPPKNGGGISNAAFGGLASEFAGLAVLFYVSSFLLDFLGRQQLWRLLHLPLNRTPYVVVDINAVFHAHLLNEPLNYLESLDLGIAFGATAVSLLLLGTIGILSVATGQANPRVTPPPPPATPGTFGPFRRSATLNPVQQFLDELRRTLGPALDQVLLSLRLVLGPLVWLIPAFSIARFASELTNYFNISAQVPSRDVLALFLPISAAAQQSIGQGFLDFVLGAVAVGTVIIAVAVVEHDIMVIQNTLRILTVAGRAIALTLAFFTFSLAALNAFYIFVLGGNTEPFQVGAVGLLALLVGVGFAIYGYAAERTRANVKLPALPPAPVVTEHPPSPTTTE